MPQPFRFTPANARLFAARATEKRQQLAIYRATPHAEPSVAPNPTANEVSQATRAQIAAIDARLARAASMDPETLDLLTRSKERLWKILAHAAGIAAPANFKQERKRSGNASIVDLEPVPLPSLPEANEEPAPSPAPISPTVQRPISNQAQPDSTTGNSTTEPPPGPALP